MEQLRIKNFGGLKDVSFDINTINIIIGPQATGKSIIAKLLFYFKSFIGEIKSGIQDNKSKREIDKEQINKFIAFFPKDTWPDGDFTIEYQINNVVFSFNKTKNKATFEYSDELKKIIDKGRKILKKEKEVQQRNNKIHDLPLRAFSKKFDELVSQEISETLTYIQIFIPAGRSFFSNLQSSIFSFLSSNKSLDPFLIRFGSFYESFKDVVNIIEATEDKRLDDLIEFILNSHYKREKEKDILLHADKRKVNLSNASSGQQEILPLLLILKALRYLNFDGTVLYIEEPEAHLFPNAQKSVIHILARIFNTQHRKFQYFITTHSPYILSSFNNLIYAGDIYEKIDTRKRKELFKIVNEKEILPPSQVSAFSIDSKGRLRSIIDPETKLIDQNILDNVSDDISTEFGKLMHLDV